jgi:molybdate transport system substrate-binding protein
MRVAKFKCLAAATALFALVAAPTRAATITVAVTPVAAGAVTDLVSDFLAAFSTAGYSVSVIVIPDADAKSAIIAGAAPVPDLFLAQSYLAPLELAGKYPRLVSGNVFPYAKDVLVLYSSASKNVDVSAGLPPLASLQRFSLPDPGVKDPYGVAAVQVLKTTYRYAETRGLTQKVSDAVSAYAAVQFLDAPYGFTGKSQICSAVAGAEEFEPGSFRHEYDLRDSDTPIDLVLAGVKIARQRAAEDEAELKAFVRFLTGAGSVNFTQHCFKLPSAP